MKARSFIGLAVGYAWVFVPLTSAQAHHGGVSAAFGPGSPVETSSPMTLPQGKFVLFERVEVAPFKTFGDQRDEGGNDKFTFTNTLFGFGITDAVSGYVSLPYARKELINDSTSQGFGDINLIVQYGFKYGSRDGYKGWYSFDRDDATGKDYTLPEWKFGLSFSTTLPSGKIHNRDRNGEPLDVSVQPGFAVPSYNITGIASKMVSSHWTWSGDIQFRTFTLNGGSGGGKPGNETRLNNALIWEAFENRGAFLSRVDLIGEANFLDLRKDMDQDRILDDASGGSMMYLSPGARFTFYDRASLGLLYKKIVWKDLNHEDQQQGGEGLEKYRFIATFSVSF
ncbi:MAG: hypothetical protein LBV36_07195 [Chromatiales bacterium]|jgi:hypothetical protein|nr:hypothetical protein [Chromatiales bacterium]